MEWISALQGKDKLPNDTDDKLVWDDSYNEPFIVWYDKKNHIWTDKNGNKLRYVLCYSNIEMPTREMRLPPTK